MSTLDQKLAAQKAQAVVVVNNAALALSRQVAERQRQLAQELRAPVVVEMAAERADKKEQSQDAERAKNVLPVEQDDGGEKAGDGNAADARRIDVRI
jgi:hypothetical protein